MISRTRDFNSALSLLFAMARQIIPFSLVSLLFWPKPRSGQRPRDQTASIPLPLPPGSATRARPPTRVPQRDDRALMRCCLHRLIYGKQTVYTLRAISPTAAASILAGTQWDNKRRKSATVSTGIYVSPLHLFQRS